MRQSLTSTSREWEERQLAIRCQDINGLATKLAQTGYEAISIAGDYNTNAIRIATVCQEILSAKNGEVVIKTAEKDEGNSCGSNRGDISH